MGVLIIFTALAATVAIVLTIEDAKEKIVATIEEAVANLRTQVQGVGDRVAEDVANLKRIIEEEGNASERLNAAVAAIEESAATLQAIDPDPNFPATTPPTDTNPPPEPTPDAGAPTTPGT